MLVVKQVRGAIKMPTKQLETLKCLGLGRIGQTCELPDTAAVQGMIRKVSHLITWEKGKGKGKG